MFLNLNFRYTLSVLFLLFLCIKLSKNAALSIYEQKKYKNLIEGQGLYSPDDDVEILTVDNFKKELYGQKHAWLIEFYNSWCGFCQRFAPSWKALASDIRGWKDLIKIGAIDCSDDKNSPICREFEIMGYPTLRYFYENYEEGLGMFGDDTTKGDDVHSHRHHLIRQIISEQKEGRGKIFPNLIPYSYPNVNHLFDSVPASTRFVFLIFEDKDMTIGPEVALDLHNIPQTVIRYTLHNNTELTKNLGIKTLPYMIVLSNNRESHQFSSGLKTRESFRMAIKEFLKSKEIVVPEQERDSNEEIYTGKWLESKIPDMNSLMEAREGEVLKEKVKKMGDVVFQMDLETALRYSLKHEVANVKNITGEKLEALKNYLNVLVKYFPLGRQGQVFLVELRDKVNEKSWISGFEIADFISSVENEDQQVFSSPQQWLACKGSTPEHRGYPCGLWKMFHFLTVNAAEHNVGKNEVNPLEVLHTMHGYIKNFFGCADCSKHFQEMSADKKMDEVSTLDGAIMWLWMAHNQVNKRLSGDDTEDPEYPKIQFPKPENCPQCRKDDDWNLPEVLKYLKQTYSGINVRYIGSDTRILHLGLEGTTTSSGATGIFKKIDASMCFILYVSSFILLVVLIRMFLKRGYRKKMYVHDLLGKV